MNKPWYQSFTMVGGAIFAAITFLEQSGAIPSGTTSQITSMIQAGAGLLALYGLRRAMKP